MLKQTIKIIKNAGDLIEGYRANGLKISQKSDGSFVTDADKKSEKFLVDSIKQIFGPEQIIISEELAEDGVTPDVSTAESFWLIDPIDATYSYINGLNDYCINIAYLKKGQPYISLIYAPNFKTLWYSQKGHGAFKQVDNNPPVAIKVRDIGPNATAVTSKKGHHLSPENIKKFNITEELVVSSAIKFCYIAEGLADYYFRTKNYAKDWDVASGILIVQEAGGEVIFTEQDNYAYGLKPFIAPSLIAKGKTKH